MSLQKVPVNNFRGGLNTRDGPFDLQPNESPELLNVTVSNLVGQLESRGGNELIENSQFPNEKVDNAKQCVLGATGKRFLLLSINGNVYAFTENELKKLHAGTAGAVWDFEVYSDAAFKDWVYMGNGVDAMQKWDGEAGATVAWTATKGAIPLGGVVCVWENRMFVTYVGANSQRLYFSEFGDPEATVAEYGFVDVRGSEEDLDAIQDLAVLGARLMVLKRRGVFFISSAVTMLNRHIGGPGAWGRFMTAELEDKLYFLNPQGIFATGGVEVAMESGSITNLFDQLHFNEAPLNGMRLVATKDTYPRLLAAMPMFGLGIGTRSGLQGNNVLIEMVPKINFRRIGGRRYLLLPAFFIHSIEADTLACWNPTAVAEQITMIGPGRGIPPGLALTDNFSARAVESPLSDVGKWTHWPWTVAAGALVEEAGKKGVAPITANTAEGARWNPASIANPTVAMKLASFLAPGNGDYFCLNLNFSAAERSGYTARFEKTAGEGVVVTIEKWVAGVKTILGTFTNYGFGGSVEGEVAFTYHNGKLVVWSKAKEHWGVLLEAEDETFNAGYCGFEIKTNAPKKLQSFSFTNFSETAELSEKVERIYKLFAPEQKTDDGVTFEAYWRSAWLAIQEQEPKERLRRINVDMKGDAIIEVFKDFVENIPAFSQELPKSGVLKEYNEPVNPKYRFTRVRPETHGRYHQIRFVSLRGKSFQINGAELAVRGGKEH